MKVHIKHWSAVAQWRWNTRNIDPDDEGDVCGICRVPYEGCCPSCKMPGDDCPLSEHPSPPSISETGARERFADRVYNMTLSRPFFFPSLKRKQYGASAVTYFICTAYSSGSVPLRRNNNVRWIVDLGVCFSFSFLLYSPLCWFPGR